MDACQYLPVIVHHLRAYFDQQLREEQETGAFYLIDEGLGGHASCATTGQVAAFYILDWKINGGDGRDIAASLIKDVRRRQLSSGAFGQPYFARDGEPTIDIAEIGAVANALFHAWQEIGCKEARESLIKAADYLLTQVARENPGAVYKNSQAKEFDVLNGDVYAAHTWGRAFELTDNPQYKEKVEEVISHITARFGRNTPGWWPYIEAWDGSVVMGNSVSYQATIVAFAHTCLPLLSPPLRATWKKVSDEAIATILEAMEQGPTEDTEVPWWSRDWSNVWEIYLALWRSDREDAREQVASRLARVASDLEAKGADALSPRVQSEADRNPVSTTFRKAATFAGILTYMALDEREL